jgi:omega-hydroxypalmitate O-feruloyl transferase
VAEKITDAREKILVPYDFLAGRLKSNARTGRLEVDCNGAGAGFVVASSECTLDEIGDLVYPNAAFAKLVVNSSDHSLEKDGKLLCIIQVRV